MRLENERLAYLKNKLEAYREHNELAAFPVELSEGSRAAPFDRFLAWASERLATLATEVAPETISRETTAIAAFSELP